MVCVLEGDCLWVEDWKEIIYLKSNILKPYYGRGYVRHQGKHVFGL